MVIPGGFQNNAGLSVQSFELLRQIVQVLGGMLNFKRFEYHFSEGAHNTNHALPFGNVNAYCVHDLSSIFCICNRNPSLLVADSIYWVTRTLRLAVAQPA